MDALAVFLNRLIDRIHPWYPVRFDFFEFEWMDNDHLELMIGRVRARIEWRMREGFWDMFHPGSDPGSIAFIQRVRDIMDGKVRDDAGNMVATDEHG